MGILEHHFPPLVAEKYGVNAAIILRDIYHWCDTNRNNGEHFHEGRWWTHQTVKGLCRRHTYWTKNQVEHIIWTCKERGALLSGHFGEDPLDRTSWYALSDEAWALFEGPYPISENSEMDFGKSVPRFRKNPKCNKDKDKAKGITPYSPPEGDADRGDQNAGEAVPEPEKPVPKPGKHEPDRALFDQFWAAYPRKQAKEKAWRAWKKLDPDEALCRQMAKALDRHRRSQQWQRDGGAYIPYPATWLNGRRWEDEPDAPASAEAPMLPEEGRWI